MRPPKTIFLSRRDVERLIDMKETLNIVEEAFRANGRGRTQMPPKIYLRLDRYNGDLRAMPAYIESPEACGLKWVSVHPDNRKRGLPAVMATILLNDPKTGALLAVMDGTHITNLRTGAAGGVAAKYLARPDSRTVALVGCGVQAETQLLALLLTFDIDLVSLYDIQASRVASFVKRTRHLNIGFRPCPDIARCVHGADIVVTTTPSRAPIVRDGWVSEGAHINAIGADAPGKEELDPAILKKSKIVVDDLAQAAHSGEINVPLAKKIITKSDICASLGEIAAGKKAGRTHDREITVFDSTGLAILDVAVACYVYRRARRHKTGHVFAFSPSY